MKNWFITYPNRSRLIIGAFLLTTALISSGLIHVPYVPVGMVLVILVTWLMLLSEKRNLSALGFDLKARHLILIPAGLFLGITSYLLSFYVGSLVRGDNIISSHTINLNLIFKNFWNVLPSSVVQDFLVVGYCYVKLIQLTNKKIATIAFGLFFICMHDVWGENIISDIFYASGLFMGYLMFSTAFLRSGSIWLVIGIHWGNNFANTYLFTFPHKPTSWLFIGDQPNPVNTIWQAIGLFIALIIGAVGVIIITKLIWPSKSNFNNQYLKN